MSGYATHKQTNLVVLAFVSGYFFSSVTWDKLSFFCLGYLFATYFSGPDNDLWWSRTTQNWKWGRFIWWPYSKVFSHRSVFTHSVFLGTVIRFFYLLVVTASIAVGCASFVAYASKEWGDWIYHQLLPMFALLRAHPEPISFLFLGLCLSDFCHILVDRISTLSRHLVSFILGR